MLDMIGMFFYLLQFVVIFIICVVALLFLYMMFLLCLDPLLIHRTKMNYVEQRNEEVRTGINVILVKFALLVHQKSCC